MLSVLANITAICRISIFVFSPHIIRLKKKKVLQKGKRLFHQGEKRNVEDDE